MPESEDEMSEYLAGVGILLVYCSTLLVWAFCVGARKMLHK